MAKPFPGGGGRVGAGRIAILAIARQYFDLAKESSSLSLGASYQRTADEYRVQAQGELRILERERRVGCRSPPVISAAWR
jgi:hypothetical protein